MDIDESRKFLQFLSPFVSDQRKERIESVLGERTKHIAIVLEDIFQSQNANAVIRTCECLGIQDVHIIEQRNSYQTNKDVLSGSGKWVDIYRYQSDHSAKDCFDSLRKSGYKIVGATPGGHQIIEELNLNEPMAIVFGTELEGLSDYAKANVDVTLRIPISGFTESFNLSVSAAIIMSKLRDRVRKELKDEQWRLSEEQLSKLRVSWYLKATNNSEKLEKEFYRLQSK